jgi:AGZA family xanthine/uracil permease-like MFS transporter
MLEKFFKLKENGTDVKTEIIAGVTTFMAMAYILAVNPDILSASGMPKDAILIATALAAFIGTMCMGLMANYPFALAPGLGLNAYFAYTVCLTMGYSWQFALFAVFIEGLIFIVLSVTPVREAIFNAIPLQLKKGVSVGIGLFVAFIGLQNGKIVVDDGATLVTIVSFRQNFTTIGIWALLTIIGIFIIAILHIKKIKGAILIGILLPGSSEFSVNSSDSMFPMQKPDSIPQSLPILQSSPSHPSDRPSEHASPELHLRISAFLIS